MNRLTVVIFTICSLAFSQTTDLFLSEYAEGSSNNKYIEIYNGTGADVDLSGYSLSSCSNGCDVTGEWDYPDNVTFAAGTMLTDGDVFVVYHGSADAAIVSEGDQTFTYLSNGDDVFALTVAGATAGTYTIIDIIGDMGGDPGSGWDVAGVTDGTKDHTLVRKSTVTSGNTDWSASAGTDADNSEWIVYPQNTWDYIGSHPHVDPAISITSPADGSTLYSSDVTISFDISNFTVGTSGSGDGHLHYALDGGTTVMQYTTSDIALTGLSEASHTFIIWLVDDSHANLNPHVADTVSFTVASPPTVTPIENIQTATDAGSGDDCYPSPEDGNNVTVEGIITAVSSSRFYIQDGPDVWDGIYVYDSTVMPSEGDEINITAEVNEYYGLTQLLNVASSITLSSGNDLYSPIVITTGDLSGGCAATAELYEGLLVKIENVVVTQAADNYGQWFIDDGSGACEVEDSFFAYSPVVDDTLSAVIGVVSYGYSEYELNPRDEDDIILSDPPLEIPELKINEFLAATDQCCDDGYGEMEDFIEIYNSGTDAVDIGGLWITDDLTDVGIWEQIPTTDATTTTVAAGGHIVIWADKDQSSQGILHTDDIKLSADGEDIGLIFISGTDTIFVDSLSFGAQTDDISYGRYPDGSDNWIYFNPPSPGTTNVSGVTVTDIYDIQYTTDASGDSPLYGQTVTISGVVTAEFWGSSSNRYLYVQDAAGPWNGVVCFEYDGWDMFDFTSSAGTVHSVAEGDSVTVTGTVDEYYNLTEIVDVTEVIIHGPAVNMISSAVVTTGQIMTGGSDAEAYEGCLVKVDNVTVDDPDLGNGEWSVTDGTNSLRVDDIWDYYYFPDSGQALAGVAGVMTYTYSNTKLEPRLARDVVEADGDLVRLQRIQQVLYSDLLNTGNDSESDISYMLEDTVTIEGIVTMPTGLSYAGAGIKFIFQDENGGPWSSILSYDPDSSAFPVLYEGDRIQATGYVYEYTTGDANMTELFITAPINILEVGVDVPEVEVVETGDLRWPTKAEQWGNVTVKVEEGIVTNNDLQYEIFEVDDGSGGVLVDDDSDSIQVYFDAVGPPPVGTFVSSISGWVYHHYGSYSDSTTYKLEPLYVSDINFGAGPPVFSDVSRDPCAPGNDEDVVVSAVITDNSVVSSAEIMYSVDGGAYQSVTMVEGTDDTWTGTIPHVSPGGSPLYYYYISATDDGADQDEPKTSTYPYDIENDQLGYWGIDVLYIENIQYTDWPSGNSLYDDCEVTVTGIVTADTAQYNSGYGAYAIQDNNDVWDGIIFDGWDDTELTRGNAVTITGTVAEFDPEWHFKYDNNTKIIDVSSVTVTGEGSVENLVLLVSTEDLAQDADEVESYEGCLVTVSGVTVSAVNAYDWSIIDDSGVECLIDDDMANMATNSAMSALTEGETLANVSGIFNFSFGTYKIQIRDMADLGQLGIDDDFAGVAREFALYPNYPNPFNPETRIRFQLAENSNVRLMIYDVLGRKVRTLVSERMDAGHHVLNWNGLNDAGADVASGMYVYRIKAGDFIAHRKMLLVR
ncbi:MAG: lamin tail domain-containing protein [Candidatus Marinimicrobia bacterium]|jgi:predicted extracellular nuclease|nr:lamin tail domain-containing protein [Candidatus Neomarinimicrobiota bacterium]